MRRTLREFFVAGEGWSACGVAVEMTERAGIYSSALRPSLASAAQLGAETAHVESYGDPPVIVFAPENGRHGNFFILLTRDLCAPRWLRHSKDSCTGRSLPRPEHGPNGETPRRCASLIPQ